MAPVDYEQHGRTSLHSGEWDAAHGHLRGRDSFDGALRLVISEPA